MRWNENEVKTLFASRIPDWEGFLTYLPPKSGKKFINFGSSSETSFYFKLIANCLFYSRAANEPIGVLVLENFHLRKIENCGFCINFSLEDEHKFWAENELKQKQWMDFLNNASYQKLRQKLQKLQIEIREITNRDPLEGSALASNPNFKVPEILASFQEFKPEKPPRTKTKKANFQSHVTENWEKHSPHYQEEENNGASFQSHIDVPTADLIKF